MRWLACADANADEVSGVDIGVLLSCGSLSPAVRDALDSKGFGFAMAPVMETQAFTTSRIAMFKWAVKRSGT